MTLHAHGGIHLAVEVTHRSSRKMHLRITVGEFELDPNSFTNEAEVVTVL
jgi:hypothetical protein